MSGKWSDAKSADYYHRLPGEEIINKALDQLAGKDREVFRREGAVNVGTRQSSDAEPPQEEQTEETN